MSVWMVGFELLIPALLLLWLWRIWPKSGQTGAVRKKAEPESEN